MLGTPAYFRERNTLLNLHAKTLTGGSASFGVHLWGSHPCHLSNSLHKHSFFEICYVLDGTGSYWEEGIYYPLEKATIFCSRPEIYHQIFSDDGLYLLWVSFDLIEHSSTTAIIQQFLRLRSTNRIIRYQIENSPTAGIWRSLWAQTEQFHPEFSEVISGLAYSLLVSYLQLFNYEAAEWNKGETRHVLNSVLLNQAKLYISDNISGPLKLEEVSGHLHISGRHLTRLFSSDNSSFSDYVRREKMNKAVQLLLHSEKSLKQIAEECGFSTVHYFSRVFTAEKGMPPGAFRKN